MAMKPMKPTPDADTTRTRAYADVAVLIPCLNEEKTVGKVVGDFRRTLEGARVMVFDNNSTDDTAAIAERHGATVVRAPRQGKGNVVKQMFDQIEAEVYVMVDGDDTYPADAASQMIAEFRKGGVDMLVGVRQASAEELAYRRFHRFGNLRARQVLRVGRDCILEIEDQRVRGQRARLLEGPRIRTGHVEHAAARADRHQHPQSFVSASLASMQRACHCFADEFRKL